MSEIDRITEIKDRAGTGAPNFTFGVNFAGSDSGINPHSHTEGSSEPGSPNNGDTWWDSGNDIYKVYMDNAWKDWLGTSAAAAPAFMGVRGLIMGGSISGASNNTMQYVTIATPGDATDFGDMTIEQYYHACHSNGSRAVSGGGYNGSTYVNTLQYATIGTAGNGTDFGDLTEARAFLASAGDDTRSLFSGGSGLSNTGAPGTRTESRTIDYITTANTGNATDFGDLSYWRDYVTATSDATRTVFAGGEDYGPSGAQNIVRNYLEYVTTQTAGNVTDFGDLTLARYALNSGVIASLTRGLFMGGYGGGYSNVIDYITIQTTGNATDFGDMMGTGILNPATCADGTTGVIAGGAIASSSIPGDSIQKVTIATAANAVDFGDLNTSNSEYGTACSGT